MINDLFNFFRHLFDTQGWVARWVCGRWTPELGWTYIISSLLIGTAYFAIPATLFRFLRKRKDISVFGKIFWLFILFIFSCGITHFTDAAMFWYPAYRFSAIVLFVTAIVSWIAVIALHKVIPVALSLKSPTQLEEIIRQRTEDLEKKNEELLALNNQLSEANRRTELLMKQKDEFLDIASHELKTPVTSLKVTLQMVETFTKTGNQNPNVSSLANKANKQIVRLTSLVENLLDITKIQAGKLQLNTSHFSISQAMKEWIDQAIFYAGKHKIVLEADEEIWVEGDRNRLEQVVVNLISNAVKYSPDSDKVMVSLHRENNGTCAKICVTDYGIGIHESQAPFVFDRFFRAKEGHAFTGLGLGLYISSQIIQQHGGTIGVTSQINEGSCFWFTLQTAPEAVAASCRSSEQTEVLNA